MRASPPAPSWLPQWTRRESADRARMRSCNPIEAGAQPTASTISPFREARAQVTTRAGSNERSGRVLVPKARLPAGAEGDGAGVADAAPVRVRLDDAERSASRVPAEGALHGQQQVVLGLAQPEAAVA